MKKIIRHIFFILCFVCFIIMLMYYYNQLKDIKYVEIITIIKKISYVKIIVSFVLSTIYYLVLSGYDIIAFHHINSNMKLNIKNIMIASFVSNVFVSNAGYQMFFSWPIRYKLYSFYNVLITDITKIVIFSYTTIWVGFILISGFIFSIITIEQKIVVNNNFIRIIGLFFIIAIILYILFSIFCSRPIKLFKWTIRFPNIKTVLFQILLSTCDWFIASFILYIFISPSKVPYCFFLEVFLISQLAGIVCQTPGGLMALEISITSLLKNYLSSSTIMSGLLLYRIVLYFFPLLIASILFVLLEIFVSTKKKLRIYY